MYKVVEFFTDLQDNDHPYHAGDKFPRDGAEVSDDRIAELASTANKRGIVLIEATKKAKKQPESAETKADDESVGKVEKKTKKANKKEK